MGASREGGLLIQGAARPAGSGSISVSVGKAVVAQCRYCPRRAAPGLDARG